MQGNKEVHSNVYLNETEQESEGDGNYVDGVYLTYLHCKIIGRRRRLHFSVVSMVIYCLMFYGHRTNIVLYVLFVIIICC